MLFVAREQNIGSNFVMNENETFVDVGANVGSYTLSVANKYKDKGVKSDKCNIFNNNEYNIWYVKYYLAYNYLNQYYRGKLLQLMYTCCIILLQKTHKWIQLNNRGVVFF